MSSSESSRHSTGAYRIKLGILAVLALCLVLAMSATSALASGPASLVAQISHQGASSEPSGLTVSGGSLWFTAFNGPTGYEGYRSDGSAPGTSLVKDILPGSDDSFPYDFTPAPGGGTLFFANDSLSSVGLFKSDGTPGGTTLLHQWSGSGGFFGLPFPGQLTNVGPTTFFSVDNQLWKTDGTGPGTQLLMSFSQTPNADTFSTGPAALTASGSLLFFAADDGTHGLELWKSDGTTTAMIQDTDTTTTGSGGTKSGITDLGFAPIISLAPGKVLFGSRDNGTANPGNSEFVQLWRSDGTTNTYVAALNPSADANPGSNGALVIAGKAYFNASDGGGAGPDDGLFKSDGTPGGTALIHTFQDSSNFFSYNGPSWLTQVGSDIYFSAQDTPAQGQELWKTDGTTVTLVKDIAPAPNASSSPVYLAVLNGQLYSSADDGMGPNATTDRQLWRTDPVTGNTVPLSNVLYPEGGSFNPINLVAYGSSLYMVGQNPSVGEELFSTDGSSPPTPVTDLNTDTNGSFPNGTLTVGGRTVFLADDGVNGQQVFGTDGTPGGTSLIKQISGGFGHTAFSLSALGSNHAVFGGSDQVSPDTGLWLTDGTAGGTSQIATLPGGFSDAVSAGSKVFFVSSTPSAGRELWVTDGTGGGTQMVKDIVSGLGSSNPELITPSGTDGVVYFFAYDGAHFQLFKSDGTPVGTTQLTHMTTGFPNSLTPVGSKVFFDNSDPTHGQELWVYDPGAGDASVVKDIDPGSTSSEPEGLAAFGSRVVFFADDGTHGSEPWISDGTAAGTQLIKDINSGPNGSPGSSGGICVLWCAGTTGFTLYNGALYFAASDGSTGGELWRTDGTAAGTAMVKDINAGAGDGDPSGFTAFNGRLYFSATNGGANNGTELWQTDGTGAGTVMTQDIFPGTGNSFPDDFAVSAGKLFFGADDGTHGYELWVLGLPSIGGGGGGTPTPATTGPPIGTRPPLLTVLTDAQIRAGLGHVRCSVARDRKSLVCVQSVPVFAALLQWSLTSTQTTAGTRAVTATAVDSAKKKKKKKKTIILGTLSKRNVKPGQVRYTIKLTTSGRRFLRKNKKAKIVLKTTLTESNKHKVSVSKTINPTGRRKIK